jgi:hypothetical protein
MNAPLRNALKLVVPASFVTGACMELFMIETVSVLRSIKIRHSVTSNQITDSKTSVFIHELQGFYDVATRKEAERQAAAMSGEDAQAQLLERQERRARIRAEMARDAKVKQ